MSTIDTALLLGGALFCQSYFTGDGADDLAIRAYADSLYRRVNWPWAIARPPALSMGWHPETGFIPADWKGYNEAIIAMVLGLGSPTYPLETTAWDAWVSTYAWRDFLGRPQLDFAPLFGHQYSHVWIDFRGIHDGYMRGKGIDYFENSRRAVLSQRQYAMQNPMGWRGYGANLWGLTASDGPLDGTLTIDGTARTFHTYWARGVSAVERRDDGTIAPTAAVASIAFAPEVVAPATVAMREYGGGIVSGPTVSWTPSTRRSATNRHACSMGGWMRTHGWSMATLGIVGADHRHARELAYGAHLARHADESAHRAWLASCRILGRLVGWRAGDAVIRLLRSLAALSLAVLATCDRRAESDGTVVLRFWAMGREGEVVKSMIPAFEDEHPGIRVRVQQLPWSAAHEKLLTAHVGDVTPDVAQLGNTWVPEFVALRALEPLSARTAASLSITADAYFPGIWDTNVLSDTLWGVPWYVDTRLLFYRTDLLRDAGVSEVPTTWEEWRAAMEAVRVRSGSTDADVATYGAFLPTNEWNVPIILGLQAGSSLLRERDTRGAFSEPAFRRAFEYFTGLYRDGLAPKYGSNDVANMYQEFARGRFVFYVSGPWQIGEFSRRLPQDLQGQWATAPMPGPVDGVPGVSLAGGSSLVIFQSSTQKDAAWKLIEYLSRPQQQATFYELTGDLPSRPAAWQAAQLADAPLTRAFYQQLFHVVPTPKIPEWELIATRVFERVETVVRGGETVDAALAALDRDVNRILEKRRWLMMRDSVRP